MLTFNTITAVLAGVLGAAILGWLLIRRLLKKASLVDLSKGMRRIVWGVGVVAFPVALLVGFGTAIGIISIVAKPGPSLHLIYNLLVALSLGIVGALLTWLAALASALVLLRRTYGGAKSS